ncbi:MAG TPA: alpha/beta hydrolase domain-containing protein [Actinophytocola sp.]|jgi:hypothetical protein|uniref:alpha/beta hydrolase domain-containing protein n=1 Tax=Actinophytocola sp. TaxID=1872138 RepID=UPI002DFB9ED5|nr:alpha/beta hydrolase domain-containing protein [Actinophytocola sp.]
MNRLSYVAALTAVTVVTGLTTSAATSGTPDSGARVDLIGPIPSTATSHPFNTSTVDLAGRSYVEEEFFLRGKANVYDYDASGNVIVTRSGAPYENRIIVRRPADRRAFSGTVVVEIMNMTNRWDLDRMWLTSHDQYLRNGDAFVGVTSAPTTVDALKKFDPQRYASLSWADPAPPEQRCAGTALNSTAATEGGLIWDIFTQVGAALKAHGRDNPLRGLDVRKVYATGYSQSGGYLIRYINAIHPRARVYDGFLIGAAAGGPRPLGKCSAAIPAADPRNIVRPTGEPVIRVQTETDFYSDAGYSRRPDSDTRADRYRLYEVPGSAHAYSYTASFAPSLEDLARAGFTYNYYNCTDPGLSTDFPMHYLFNAAQVLLDRWARAGTPPPHADRIQVDPSGRTVPDQYGNATGGVRTPWLDVPVATYYPSSTPAATCSLQGHRLPFDPARLKTVYPDHGTYVRPFIAETERLVTQGWLTRPDADAVINTAANASIPT